MVDESEPRSREQWRNWVMEQVTADSALAGTASDAAFRAMQKHGNPERAGRAAFASLAPEAERERWGAWVSAAESGIPQDLRAAALDAALMAIVLGGSDEEAAQAAYLASSANGEPKNAMKTGHGKHNVVTDFLAGWRAARDS